MAYVTCSPHLAETRDVVTAVLAGRGDAEVLDAPAVLPEVPGLRCPDPHGAFAQFWPHRHGTDAIFLALLRRTAWFRRTSRFAVTTVGPAPPVTASAYGAPDLAATARRR